MLQKLIIKNYALIKELHIEPNPKFNTITGETGAGKSIMLGAVGLLLGKRADTKVLYEADEKCVVEGVFNIGNYALKEFFEQQELDYEEECIIRREINSSGKSRAFINDTPTTLDVLKELGTYLMDVHSQHQTLLLGEQDFQLKLIDAYTESNQDLIVYRSHYAAYSKAKKALQQFEANNNKIKADRDYNQFLFDELDKAQLANGEQEELENQLKLLENGAYIQQKLGETNNLLDQSEYSILNSLHDAVEAMKAIQEFNKDYKELFERLNSVFIELQDASRTIEIENNNFDHDPLALQNAQDRLSLIYQLQKKHQADTIEDLLGIKSQLEKDLLAVENAEEDLAQHKKLVAEHQEKLLIAGNALSKKRKAGFKPLEKELKQLLADLGMEDASILFEHQAKDPDSSGLDNINILFSANKGIAPQLLKSVASGGEFSRLLFAFKYIMADKISMPTIIFDEIDTGISGEIALKMVYMMQRMAKNHQLITISHLPQIAAKGDDHYFVYKDNTQDKSVSKIKLLNKEERIVEIGKMIGGEQASASALKSAEELLTQ